MRKKSKEITDDGFYSLDIKALWRYFKSETFAFWMITLYLFTEYVRPQSILPWLDFLPWAQLFLIGSLLGLLIEPNRKWVKSPINKWLIIYFFVILASSFNAFRPNIAFDHIENYYLWVIIYFLIINIVTTEKRLIIFLSVFLLASYKISLSLAQTWGMRGFAFTSWGLKGPSGFFENSGELAIQMAVYWPIAIAFVLYFKDRIARWKKWVLISMPITAAMVILGSSSRGGQLAFLVQIAVRYARQIYRPKLLIALAIALFIGWKFLPAEQKERFEQMGEDQTSQQRLLYWKNGIEMTKENPVLGVGYYNFIPYYEAFYREDMFYDHAELPHNIFIQVSADNGIIGLIVYLFIIFSSVNLTRKSIKKSKEYNSFSGYVARSLNISLIGFIIAGQFVSVVYYPFLWIHLAVCSCVYSIINSQHSHLRRQN